MVVTATELKQNLGKYLELAATQDVLISKNGKPVATLVSPRPPVASSRPSRMKSLFGILPSTASIEEARTIREEEKWGLS